MRRAASTTAQCVLLALVMGAPASAAAAADAPPLSVEATIPLPGTTGRIDHMALDIKRNRLFVAELGNNTVDVIDLVKKAGVHRIKGLKEPQGVGYSPQADVLAVANAGDGSVHLFKGEDFAPLGVVLLGDDADNIRVEASTGHFVIGYGSGGLATLNPTTLAVTARAKLPAHPEGFQLDANTRRAFVNVPDAGQIAVLAGGEQIATWRVPGLGSNFPIALDPGGAVLAAVFRNPARLVLLDARTGRVAASLSTCGDADDVFFDAKRHRLYVSCGDGAVDVVQESAGSYRALTRIKTSSGARTSLFVPEMDRLFVAKRAGLLGSDAAILVFRPAP